MTKAFCFNIQQLLLTALLILAKLLLSHDSEYIRILCSLLMIDQLLPFRCVSNY